MAISAATRSMAEWTASEMTLTECMASPTPSLRTIRVRLEAMESLAARVFSFCCIGPSSAERPKIGVVRPFGAFAHHCAARQRVVNQRGNVNSFLDFVNAVASDPCNFSAPRHR